MEFAHAWYDCGCAAAIINAKWKKIVERGIMWS